MTGGPSHECDNQAQSDNCVEACDGQAETNVGRDFLRKHSDLSCKHRSSPSQLSRQKLTQQARNRSDFRPEGRSQIGKNLEIPNLSGSKLLKASEKYRLKALTCEKLAREATDDATKAAWEELAIEWHILASRIAKDDKDDEID